MTEWIKAVAILMLVAMVPVAMAEEGNQGNGSFQGHDEASENAEAHNSVENESLEVSSETQAEMEAATTAHGAKVRLLQLEKAIQRNIFQGNAAINAIVEANASANTTGLKAIIEELAALKLQVSQANPTGGSESAQQFVEFKNDAIELSHKFRTQLRQVVRENDLEKVRLKAYAKSEDTEMARLNGEIRHETRTYNAEVLQKILVDIGASNGTLVEKARNGEAGKGEIMAAIRLEISSMDKEQKKEAIARLNEDLSRKQVMKQAAIAKAKTEFLKGKEARIEMRIEKIQNRDVKGLVKKRLDVIMEKRAESGDGKARAEGNARTSASGEGINAGVDGKVGVNIR
ncbi:hypothetical protein HYY72_01435 [Candidatus Woesearchaeota archaeon]|nr:hypothetical protein [Candidatus Woesearchaeota archaeon]